MRGPDVTVGIDRGPLRDPATAADRGRLDVRLLFGGRPHRDDGALDRRVGRAIAIVVVIGRHEEASERVVIRHRTRHAHRRTAERDDGEQFESEHGRDCESQSRTLDDKGKTRNASAAD